MLVVVEPARLEVVARLLLVVLFRLLPVAGECLLLRLLPRPRTCLRRPFPFPPR